MTNIYNYNILNYYLDDDYLFIEYTIVNSKTLDMAHCCFYDHTNYIETNAELNKLERNHTINDELVKIISKNKGREFTLPKTSELHPVTYKLYKELKKSECNMLFVNDKDDLEMYDINIKDLDYLKDDIRKFNLDDYIVLDGDDIITVYGGLQCIFNDNIEKRNNERER